MLTEVTSEPIVHLYATFVLVEVTSVPIVHPFCDLHVVAVLLYAASVLTEVTSVPIVVGFTSAVPRRTADTYGRRVH